MEAPQEVVSTASQITLKDVLDFLVVPIVLWLVHLTRLGYANKEKIAVNTSFDKQTKSTLDEIKEDLKILNTMNQTLGQMKSDIENLKQRDK